MNPILFRRALLSWFTEHAREMPWRENRDPYRIWVSEIMLQQTQVKTVHEYFLRFIKRFPTVTALAEAPETQVLKAWEGLGYYSRARNLHRGAQYVIDNFQGQIPANPAMIRQIPGIGPYSAGAILSIAYDLPEPAIDGNVIRVFSRLEANPDTFEKADAKKALEAHVRQFLPTRGAGDFNQALMELGALICTPRQPKCVACPVSDFCQARLAGNPEIYPFKGKKTAVKTLDISVAVVRNRFGEILLQHQQERGIFKNLWCLPHSEGLDYLALFLENTLGHSCDLIGPVGQLEHRLTHRLLKMKIYLVGTEQVGEPSEALNWVAWEHPDHAVPVAHKKILKLLEEQPLLWSQTTTNCDKANHDRQPAKQ